MRSRAVQMQQDELKQQRRHVHEGASSINTTGIEKAQVSRRKPRMARPGLRSGLNTHVEAVEAPTETRHRILQHAAEEVAEQTITSRELAGWNVPVRRANPQKKAPQRAHEINRQVAKKNKAYRAKKKGQIDPKLQELLHTLEAVPPQD